MVTHNSFNMITHLPSPSTLQLVPEHMQYVTVYAAASDCVSQIRGMLSHLIMLADQTGNTGKQNSTQDWTKQAVAT